ncbi:hypothetical protein RLPCCGM1_c2235 [Rhizobium leguminosarum bv. phaseoli CCGM1]|nr:hypothetical protein RLPCCGM1_c2235 [Rhizobium leguminosarum bv. phaseoli CCGM1]
MAAAMATAPAAAVATRFGWERGGRESMQRLSRRSTGIANDYF